MVKVQAEVSDNNVLIYCGSPEEAQNLQKAVSVLEMDKIDDALLELPLLRDDNKSLNRQLNLAQKEIEKLYVKIEKLTRKQKFKKK